MTAGGARAQLEQVLQAALSAVDAGAAVARVLTSRNGELAVAGRAFGTGGRVWVLAIGKAAVPMAAPAIAAAGDRLAGGLAITKDGYGGPLDRVVVREAGHPVPDARSEQAAHEALGLVARAAPEDALLVLLSGGASSLLAGPAPGLSLADVATTTSVLLACGAPIDELNAVRKHLSSVSGGRLGCRAACARIEVLAVSDVPGDRLDVIGSGPFAADPSTFADALSVLEKRGLAERVPAAVRVHLQAGARGEHEETPKPDDAALARIHTTVLANNETAVHAAVAEATRVGLRPVVISRSLAGEARHIGRRLAAAAASLNPDPDAPPLCLIAGGETTVTVRGPGRGGRNQELALAAALVLDGRDGVALLAAGTDGTDGPTDAAGAYADGASVARAAARGVDAAAALNRNDSNRFFEAAGGLLVTGPTRTNVMDLALLRVSAARSPRD